ncbi:hypothetical protein V2I01_39125 [Micromonospora sp. BRA006-A]|nr:hypothetical protein [Micromonospora sp. BRA006-A]
MPIGAFATARLNAFVGAEAAGRLTLLRAGPVSRARLLAAEVGSASAATVALALAAGLATWLGTALVGAVLPSPPPSRARSTCCRSRCWAPGRPPSPSGRRPGWSPCWGCFPQPAVSC